VASRHFVALTVTLALLIVFSRGVLPVGLPDSGLHPLPDALLYAQGAQSILQGHYTATYQGVVQTPRYTPGFSLLLAPAVAVGGLDAAVWVAYAAAVGLAATAALVAWRVAGPLAAPVAIVLVAYTPVVATFAQLVMTDVANATVGLLALACLLRRDTRGAVAAGALLGFSAWMRPASAIYLVAGAAALSNRRQAPAFVAAAVPFVVGLLLWQWATWGSPFVTGYQAQGASPDGTGSLSSLFDLRYAFTTALGDAPDIGGRAREWGMPNLPVYVLQLLGGDGFLLLPAVGCLGVAGLIFLANCNGRRSQVGRFGLASIALTLLVYAPYFWQSGRFLVLPAALLGIGAAALLTVSLETVISVSPRPRAGGAPVWRTGRHSEGGSRAFRAPRCDRLRGPG
jgi:4-amino-4-deoxy-L-arabinose transferase-like glycosyltransferase